MFSTYLCGRGYKGERYLPGIPGVIYRAGDPDGEFKPRVRLLFDPGMCPAGVWRDGAILHLVWSRVGDAPQRLLYSMVDTSYPDWKNWRVSAVAELLRPERDWEGSALPVISSLRVEFDLPNRYFTRPSGRWRRPPSVDIPARAVAS